MSEITTVEAAQEQSFEEMLEQSIKTLNTGDKVMGVVTGIGTTEVQVDLGTKHAGYIPCDEVSADPTVKPEDVLKVGDEIEVFVVRVNDQEGTCQLSRKKLEGMKAWDELSEACENKTVVEGIVTGVNKGGLEVSYKGARVFVPASQSGIGRGGDMTVMQGKMVKMKITEVTLRPRHRVIGSIRAVTAEARKAAAEKIWKEIEVGAKYHGVVKSLTSYGAFVDIGGVDGMVHVSELSWGRDPRACGCGEGRRRDRCFRHLLRSREAQDLSGPQDAGVQPLEHLPAEVCGGQCGSGQDRQAYDLRRLC